MEPTAGFGGNGVFTLHFNNKLVSTLAFKDTDTSICSFDFKSIVENPNNTAYFQKGTVLNVSLAVVNFTLTTKTTDFRAIYTAAHRYGV
jgi:hypothetical protein